MKASIIFRSVVIIGLLSLCQLKVEADPAAIRNAINSRETEIRWKLQDIEQVERDLSALQGLVQTHPASRTDINIAIAQLEAADAKLLEIQSANLLKMTIRLAIDTYGTVQSAADTAASGVTNLMNKGVSAAGGAWVADQVKGQLTGEVNSQLGVDDATLLSARSQKVRVVNDYVRNTYPAVNRVQKTLALSLEAVQAAAYQQDGTELGEVGAVFRKNLMVREAITEAVTKLGETRDAAQEARDEAEVQIPLVEVELAQLNTQLASLQTDLIHLQYQLEEALAGEMEDEVLSRITPTEAIPTPDVTVSPEPEETYQERLAQAQKNAVDAIWANQSPGLLSSISSLQDAVVNADMDLTAAWNAAADSGAFGLVGGYSIPRDVGPGAKLDPSSLAAVWADAESYTTHSAAIASSAEAFVASAEALNFAYAELKDAQNRLYELVDLVQRHSSPPSVGSAFAIPGRGLAQAQFAFAKSDMLEERVPEALTNAAISAQQAEEAWGPISQASSQYQSINLSALSAAEAALSRLAQKAAAWQSGLENIPEAGLEMPSTGYGFWQEVPQYESTPGFAQVLRRSYQPASYSHQMAQLLGSGSTADLAAADALRARHQNFHLSAPQIQRTYHEDWQAFREAWSQLSRHVSQHGFHWINSMAAAGQIRPSTPGVPDTTSINQRVNKLWWTASTLSHVTAADGSWPPIPFEPVRHWYGLPSLSYLHADVIDDHEEMVVHRLLDLRQRIQNGRTAWINLPPADFTEQYFDAWNELSDITQNFTQKLHQEANPGSSFNPSYYAAHEAAAHSVNLALWDLSSLYDLTHPKPEVVSISEDVMGTILIGETFVTQLTVQVEGDFPSFKWQRTRWPDFPHTWEDIPGATAATLQTPPADEHWHYRCIVSNRAGQSISSSVAVWVFVQYPAPKFTSPTAAVARKGEPFVWQFVTDIPPVWWMGHSLDEGLVPGLSFNAETGTITGTPTTVGRYVIPVGAFNFGGSLGFQEFTLTVIEDGGNPFSVSAAATSYAGLVRGEDPMDPQHSGLMTLRITSRGTYSGRLHLAGSGHSLKGRFNSDGEVNIVIPRRNLPVVTVKLAVEFNEPLVRGDIFLSPDAVTPKAALTARATPSERNHPDAGRYTVLLPDASGGEFGTGSGILTISRTGKTVLRIVLPDASACSFSGRLDAAASLSVYRPLYKGLGFFSVHLRVEEEPDVSDVHGMANWIRPEAEIGAKSQLYREGFQSEVPVIACRYIRPQRGIRAFDLPDVVENALMTVWGGDLTGEILSKAVTWPGNNKLAVVRQPENLRLKFYPKTGLVKGSFRHDVTEKTTRISAAVFQKQNRVDGLFPGIQSSGGFSLAPVGN
jgi:hypothetical protein